MILDGAGRGVVVVVVRRVVVLLVVVVVVVLRVVGSGAYEIWGKRE